MALHHLLILTKHPDDYQARIEAARELAENGKAQEAIALLDAVTLLNTDEDMLQRRAGAYRVANAPEKAAADLTTLLARRPDARNLRVKLAEYLALAGKPAEAMAAWREAGQPVNTEFARVLLDKSYFAEALEVLGTAGTQGGWAVDVALLRARALEGTGQIETMVASLESIYNDLSANGQEGLVLRLGTQLEKSASWQALLGMDGLRANPFVNHVLLSMTRNMNPDEAAPLREALISRIDPASFTRRDDAENFGLVLRQSGQRDQAIAVLVASAKLPRTSPHSDRALVDALYNLEARSESAGLLIDLSRTSPEILTRDPAYFFISTRTAVRTTPVSAPWIIDTLGVLPSTIRQDRILHEAIATGGDIRRLCDLFGISVMTAQRYVDVILRPNEVDLA